jgi:protein-disulfide isomerase
MSRTLLLALALFCLLGTAPPHAVAQSGGSDAIRAALAGRFPGAAIDSVRRLPSGLYEVVLDRSEIIDVDAQAETAVAGRFVALAKQLGISGTPGIVLADGTLVPGMIPAQELEAKLAATRRGS